MLAALVLLLSCPAFAMLCVQLDQKQYFKGSPLVFLGTVEAVDDTFVTLPTLSGKGSSSKDLPMVDRPRRLLKVRLRVDALWKGSQHNKVALLCSPSSYDGPGVTFWPRATYLVYADSSALGYSVSLCSRVLPRARADADLAALGKPRASSP